MKHEKENYLDCCGSGLKDCRCERRGNLIIGFGRTSEAQSILYANYLSSKRTLDDVAHALGITPDEMWTLTLKTDDQISFSTEPTGMRVGTVPTHGSGVIATKHIQKGEVIAPARVGGKRTPAGRYCNHGGDPNAEMIMRPNGDVDLVALRAIEPDTEILSDYFWNFLNSRVGRMSP